MKYRKKPVVIEAIQWNMNGDHPMDGDAIKSPFSKEGALVRYYRTPETDGHENCKYCDQQMRFHGWIDTVQGGHAVCPGDWIITDDRVGDERGHGYYYPCKPDIFEQTYEKVED